MFVGAINATVRQFLGNVAGVFNDRVVVVGCSGNFTSEAVISRYARPASVHSNDVSFYSCMVGRWLTGQALEFDIVDADYEWLEAYGDTDARRLASILVLMDMLPFDKRDNAHRVRMWNAYRQEFDDLVERTVSRLGELDIQVDSFYAGDVFDHFRRFDQEDAIFCCYAPTYSGGYERLYRRLEQIVSWDEPEYRLLDEARRDELLAWISERAFLWYDDRLIASRDPVMQQRAGRRRTVYLYSNVIRRPAVFDDRQPAGLPGLPLADASLRIQPDSRIWLHRIKVTELSSFKDAFLSKEIEFAAGTWARAVVLDGRIIGFLEYTRSTFGPLDEVYLLADFAVPGTVYQRLSKLMVMLARAGETRRLLERLRQYRTRTVTTTAFTDRPVSMKYRGPFKLEKRGQTEDGQAFLNYSAEFDEQSWSEVLHQWWTRYGSIRSSRS